MATSFASLRVNPLAAAVIALALIVTTGVAAKDAPSDIQALQARLQRLEDTESIRALLEHYIELNESRDWAAYSKLFAKDGELVMRRGRATGPEAIQSLLEKALVPASGGSDPLKGSKHVLSNIVIHVDGNTATATSRWTLMVKGDEDRPRLSGTGHYGDKLVRENGAWKFQQRIIYRDIPGDPPKQ